MPPKKLTNKQIALDCDRVIIDTITCPTKPRPIPLLAEPIGAAAPGFEATNNGGSKKKCTVISQRYAHMPVSCHKTPEGCGSGPRPGDINVDLFFGLGPGDIIVDPYLIAVQGETDAAYPGADDTVDDTEETDVTDELVGGAADDDDEDDMAEDDDEILSGGDTAQSPLQKRNNNHKHHHHKKHGHHHKDHHHHHKKPHHKKVVRHKKKDHSWVSLCTSSSNVCGHELFGCDFMSNAVYICTHPGAVPTMHGACSDVC